MLWVRVRKHPGLLCTWLAALGLSSAATLLLPVAAGTLVDQGLSNRGHINLSFLQLFLVSTTLGASTALRSYAISLLGEKVVADLRGQLFGHILGLDAQFHDRNHSGELLSRLSADCALVRGAVGFTMSVALRNVVILIASGVMLFITDVRLAIYVSIGIPVLVVPMVLASRWLRNISRTNRDLIASSNKIAVEALSSIGTVQSYVRERHERSRFDSAVLCSMISARRRVLLQALMTATAAVLFSGTVLGILWSGAHDVIAGNISAGIFSQFVLYALIATGSVGSLTEVLNEIQRSTAGIGRVSELLQERSSILRLEGGEVSKIVFRGDIAFEKVTFSYPQRPSPPVLDGLTLHVRSGEVVALVGPSGAGKSTLFSLLLRFYDPSQGTIQIGGSDIRNVDLAQLRAHIAVVSQQPVLFSGTIADNIRYGRHDASDEQIRSAAQAAKADEFICRLPSDYQTEVGERGSCLSGGQLQRIAIARAFVRDAPILLLDEATSAVDARSEHEIQRSLMSLMSGRTTLVVAHRLATVKRADRIIVLDKGCIVDEGAHSQLVARGGIYAEMAKLQFVD